MNETRPHLWKIDFRTLRIKWLLCLAAFAVYAHRPYAVRGQDQLSGTAFSYQGFLTQAGKAATGAFDFRAHLSSSAAGAAISTALIPAQFVSNGIFAITIDFGLSVFDGQNLWLGLEVSPAGADDFTALQASQPVTPVPYALHAQTAATALSAASIGTNAVTASQLLTAGPPSAGQVLEWDGNSLAWVNPNGVTAAASSGGSSVLAFGAKGDGSDDTIAVRNFMSTNNLVVFPNSTSNLYVVGALLIHSNMRVVVAPGVTIKMRAKENTGFVTNSWTEGTTNVTIEGGIWDPNWSNQVYGLNLPQVFNLEGITNLDVRDITILQTSLAAMVSGRDSHNGNAFRVARWRNIRFHNVNLQMQDGDGIHLNGPGENAVIEGTHGFTSDDFIALNAADWVLLYRQYDSMGPITDVTIRDTLLEPTSGVSFAASSGGGLRLEPGLGAGLTNILVDGIHGRNDRGVGINFAGPTASYGVTNGFGDNIHISHVDAWFKNAAFVASFDTNSSFGKIYLDHIYSPHALSSSGLIEFTDGNYSDVYIADCSVAPTNKVSTFPMVSVYGSGVSTNFDTAIVTNLFLFNIHMDGHVIVGNHVQGTAKNIVARNLVMDSGVNAIFNTGSSSIWAENLSGRYSGPVLLVAGGGTNRIVAAGFPAKAQSMSLSGVSSVVCLDSSATVDGTTVSPLPGDRFYNSNTNFASGSGWYTAGGDFNLPVARAQAASAPPAAVLHSALATKSTITSRGSGQSRD